MYVNSIACVRVKVGEFFRINSGVREKCIMSPLVFQCIYTVDSVIKGENGDGEEGSEVSGVGEG